MAFEGVPEETRKSFPDGTTIFERVLPGSDRMYPDTDSAPIPLTVEFIDSLGKQLPLDIADRYAQMKKWGIPEDTWKYLLSKNMIPLIENICTDHGFNHKFIGSFLGHTFKNIEGKCDLHKNFFYEKIYELFRYIKEKKLEPGIAKYMIPVIYEFPDMQFSSVLTSINFRKRKIAEIAAPIEFLREKYQENTPKPEPGDDINWIMGQLHHQAIGNVALSELFSEIDQKLKKESQSNGR
jgi:glutamyl-tRNA(Gln) amidotransferase subunit E